MNCTPRIETANAEGIVDPTTDEVRAFNIMDEPKAVGNAFSDTFFAHKASDIVQATVTEPTASMAWAGEDTGDSTFNIRDEVNGLNLDFMSYSMYSMVGEDPTALRDLTVFACLASKAFTTFFQHLASNNTSMETGSWAYQPINASLPWDLTPAVTDARLVEDAPLADQQDVIHPISHTNRTGIVQVAKRIELLRMNAVAVWLSVAILAWLIIAMVIVTVFHRQYLRRLIRDVECLGDVLVLTAGSENLVHVIQESEAGRVAESEKAHLSARLGWFQDDDGKLKWRRDIGIVFLCDDYLVLMETMIPQSIIRYNV
ncbi:hypothetical protein BBP40_004648 [Aspergillus hancockii]|nr:hypothetical protein BBP40_004648 [Aspergillus hancockii]